MSNEVTDGLELSVSDSLSGVAIRLITSFRQRVRRTRCEKTSDSDSHLAPEAWGSRKGTPQAQRAEDWCSHKWALQTHKCPTTLPTVWHRRLFAIYRAHLKRILVLFVNERRKTRGENHRFGFTSCSRGLVFPDGVIAGPNSNSDFNPSLKYSTMWCCSGSPYPIFHRGPLCRLPRTTCHILARSST